MPLSFAYLEIIVNSVATATLGDIRSSILVATQMATCNDHLNLGVGSSVYGIPVSKKSSHYQLM